MINTPKTKELKLKKISAILALVLSIFLLACGGNPGADLENFPALSKTVGDLPFTLTAPSSSSPGAFSYSSSDATVASIAGNTVTVIAAGSATITATQAATGKWGAASISAILTVSAKTCTLPATLQNGVCSAPAFTGNFVSFGGKSWMPVGLINTWAEANTFCTTASINGQTGWRLPVEVELTELYKNVNLNNQGWLFSNTWTSTVGTVAASRRVINLSNGTTSDLSEVNSAYFSCIK
jgi:hypothetical protein